MNNEVLPRQGTFRDMDNINAMSIWIEYETNKPIQLYITKGKE